MTEFITVVPAYGRDYKSQREVLADWNANKDFQIATFGPNDGRMINKQQVMPGMTIHARYSRLTKIVQVTK